MTLLAVESAIWLPALSGAIGALIGAGASVVGIHITGKQQEGQRAEERRQALEDHEREVAEGTFKQAAATMADALSLLHEIAFLASEASPPSAEQLAGVGKRWTALRDQLLIVGSTYPDPQTSERTIELVGKLSGVVNWLEGLPGATSSTASPVNEAIGLVVFLLDRYRANENLPPVFEQEAGGSLEARPV